MKIVKGITNDYRIEAEFTIGEFYKKECQALYDAPISELLLDSQDYSIESVTFLTDDDCIAGIGGIAEVEGIPGYCIWFIGTTQLDTIKNKIRAWSLARDWVQSMKAKYYRLTNFCLHDDVHFRVLQDLGFEIFDTDRPEVKRIVCA